MPAGLFARHHHAVRAEGIEGGAALVGEIGRRQQARGEALADEAALREAADRCEAEAHHLLPVADDIGGERDEAGGEPARWQRRIGVPGDRDRALADVEDPHRGAPAPPAR